MGHTSDMCFMKVVEATRKRLKNDEFSLDKFASAKYNGFIHHKIRSGSSEFAFKFHNFNYSA